MKPATSVDSCGVALVERHGRSPGSDSPCLPVVPSESQNGKVLTHHLVFLVHSAVCLLQGAKHSFILAIHCIPACYMLSAMVVANC